MGGQPKGDIMHETNGLCVVERRSMNLVNLRACLCGAVFLIVLALPSCSKKETTEEATPPSTDRLVAVLTETPASIPESSSTSEADETSEATEPPDPVETPTTEETPTSSSVSTNSDSTSMDMDQRLQDLETRMDSVFSDGWQDLNRQFAQSTIVSSIDLRERPDTYVFRVYLPNADSSKIDATIENGALHIASTTASADDGARSNQPSKEIINLPPSIRPDKMKTERKRNVVVVTVPKTTSSTPVAATSTKSRATPSASPADWSERLVEGMTRLKGRMDEIFRDAFPEDLGNGANVVRFGSAVRVEAQRNQYVVSFFLADTDLKDVDVKFKDGQLDLVAQQKQQTVTGGDAQTTGIQKYERMIMLPQPVKEGGMKVERSGSTIRVTIPKA